jgi:tetratricopeptide (TPR) repeat protein
MPSPRLLRRLPHPEARRQGRRIVAAPILVVLLAVGLACTSSPPPPPAQPVALPRTPLDLEPADRPYLIDPLEGYSRTVDPAMGERLSNLWRDLLEEGDIEGAARAAAKMLGEDAELFPAQVLAAQVDFATRDDRRVIERLLPVGDAMPTYTASQLLLGRATERLGDIPLAYAAYRAVAARSPLARRRAGELHSRALEIVSNRLEEALRLQRFDEADKQLELLRSWAPAETLTLEAARKSALARGDRRAELVAVKELSSRRPADRALLERRAELELAVGDPSAGLKIVENLAARHPQDRSLAEKLESAKFRWRLSQLPQSVQEIAARPELSKADLAVLLYWLVPDVRNSRPTAGRIATDVLDHPYQEEIVRVVNLGLMDVDPTLHRFSPGATVRRGPALRVLLRTLARFGKADCAGGSVATGPVCETAMACGLLPAEEDCQAMAQLSGAEGVEIIRRSLKLLGGS